MVRALSTVCLLVAGACAHGPSNEDRLDLATVPMALTGLSSELGCMGSLGELERARDVSVKRGERLSQYAAAIARLQQEQADLETVIRREPDLQYGPRAGEVKRRMEGCGALAAQAARERSGLEAELEATAAPIAVKAPEPAAQAPEEQKPKKVAKKKLAKTRGKKSLSLASADQLE